MNASQPNVECCTNNGFVTRLQLKILFLLIFILGLLLLCCENDAKLKRNLFSNVENEDGSLKKRTKEANEKKNYYKSVQFRTWLLLLWYFGFWYRAISLLRFDSTVSHQLNECWLNIKFSANRQVNNNKRLPQVNR